MVRLTFVNYNFNHIGWKTQKQEKVEVFRSGLMGPVMKDSGKTTRQMGEGDLSTQMEMFTRASGRMTRPTARVSTLTWMEADTRVTGLKTNSMGLVWRSGPMVLSMRDITLMGRSREKASSHGLMGVHSAETSLTITFTAVAFMSGLMVEYSQVNGPITRWRVMVHLRGPMAEDM
jgi:hypothetical protein